VIKALQDNNVDVISAAQDFNLTYGVNKPIDVTANFIISQDLKLPDLSTITVEKRAILDDEVEFYVEEHYKKFIKDNSAEVRLADENYQIKPNDIITVTTRIFRNDKEVMQKKEELHPKIYIMPEKKENESFYNLFVGHKPGETVEERAKFSESFKNRAIAGKEVVLKHKIEEVNEYVPIPVDKYIDDLGDPQIKTPDDIKAFIRQGVLIELEKNEYSYIIKKFIKKIIDQTEIAISYSDLESAFRNVIKRYPEFNNIPLTDLSFLRDENKLMLPEYNFFLPFINKAINEIHETYIIRHVVRKQNFSITDEDIKDVAKNLLKSEGSETSDEMVVNKVNAIMNDKELYSMVEDVILKEKAIAWLLARVTIVKLSVEETLARREERRNANEKYKQEFLEANKRQKSDEETSKTNDDQKLNMENETSDSPIEKGGEENPPSPQEESTPSNEPEE
jgi:FKBP-type peptidyl-prolyl cis-trans isomerase (trigger factor)